MMPKNDVYEYAVLRLVPRVEREEFINIGVLLLCRKQKFGAVKYTVNHQKIKALFPDTDIQLIENQLKLFQKICQGDKDAGLIAAQELHERFRWLTAHRSAMLQCSPIHIGLTTDAKATLENLFEKIVL